MAIRVIYCPALMSSSGVKTGIDDYIDPNIAITATAITAVASQPNQRSRLPMA